MTKAAIYARFSSDKQTDKSIDDQVALCRAFCAREGLTVAAIFDDRAISGASTINRLGLQRMMRDARDRQFGVVVAESLDRLSRDQEDLAGIYKRLNHVGIEIRTVQDGTAGAIHIGVKGLLGSLYLADLAQKTRRGQAGVVRDGRHNGGRSFGYRAVPGRPGILEIDTAEAEIVRRIFSEYLHNYSPRDIALALNKEGVAGPRGGAWNASTIHGSRTRMNGILQNELYAGRIVWNRQTFTKDPDTGKRISRPNPPAQWMTAEADHLRIIDAATWLRVQARRGDRAGERHRTKPKHLLSGLLKCGCCGSGYISAGTAIGGHSALLCSRMRETGLCGNKRRVAREVIEQHVLSGIQAHLGDPDIVAEYVREYHRISRELNSKAESRIASIDKRLGEVNRAIARMVDAVITEGLSRALRDRLAALEAKRDEIERERSDVTVEPIEFHPNAAKAYRDKIRNLKATLAATDPDSRALAFASIREIVEKIVIHPRGRHEPVELEIFGHLAAILGISKAAASAETPRGVMVAGTRNSHPPRLPALRIRFVAAA